MTRTTLTDATYPTAHCPTCRHEWHCQQYPGCTCAGYAPVASARRWSLGQWLVYSVLVAGLAVLAYNLPRLWVNGWISF